MSFLLGTGYLTDVDKYINTASKPNIFNLLYRIIIDLKYPKCSKINYLDNWYQG